jgi:putative molybdopterin biosynthesis protein
MHVELRLGGLITVNEREIALSPTYALLEGLAQERSVSGAAARLGLSYRAAWGRVLALEQALGRPVAVKTKGHGSVLTAFGADLRDALGTTLRSFEMRIRQEERALHERLVALTGEQRPVLRLALSHDPVLLSALEHRAGIEANVVGSEEAVALLMSGRADLAGLHTGGVEPAALPPFRDLLVQPALAVEPLFLREQGLIVARGNPLGIRSLADLARTKARFVNRQRGSGTRTWFDRMLTEAGLSRSDLRGYDVEEFTHQAVAAVVAAGAADAGMGVRLMAERFGLGFVPLGKETYYLVGPSPILTTFVEQVAPVLRNLTDEVPGYSLLLGSPARRRAPLRKRRRSR